MSGIGNRSLRTSVAAGLVCLIGIPSACLAAEQGPNDGRASSATHTSVFTQAGDQAEKAPTIHAFDGFYTIEKVVTLPAGAAGASLVAAENGLLSDMTILFPGDQVLPGDRLVSGVFRNEGKESIYLEDPATGDLFEVKPDQAVILSGGGGCSVTCKPGTYACCRIGLGCPCYPDNETHACDAGGHGAISCSIQAQ